MNWESYKTTAELVRQSAEDVVQTSFENWPETIKELAYQRPLFSVLVGPEDLQSILTNNAKYRKLIDLQRPLSNPSLKFPVEPFDAKVLFPKLGPVSWKELPMFSATNSKDRAISLIPMLQSVTDRMSLILEAFVETKIPTFLHYFAHKDFSRIIEARVIVQNGKVHRGRWTNLPKTARNLVAIRDRAIEFSREIQSTIQQDFIYIDLCIEMDRPLDEMFFLEYNPILDLHSA